MRTSRPPRTNPAPPMRDDPSALLREVAERLGRDRPDVINAAIVAFARLHPSEQRDLMEHFDDWRRIVGSATRYTSALRGKLLAARGERLDSQIRRVMVETLMPRKAVAREA